MTSLPDIAKSIVAMPDDDSLEALVAQMNHTACILWQGAISRRDGYGRVWAWGKVRLAHRVAYELVFGPIPSGLEMDHLCRNRACVNPLHLEAVTRLVNVRRGDGWKFNGTKIHCPQGHPYDKDNTRIEYGGAQSRSPGSPRRRCRICAKAALERFYAK